MGTKFEGVDILDFLGQVVELHTQHYKEDFDVDKELIQKVALSGEPEERRLLWMSRPCGTYCLSERELAVILRRERLKRDYHAKPGNVQEYMEKLKKASMRGRLKEAQAAVAAPGRGAPHKGGLDR